jgi:hypothetical protein
MNEDLPNRSNDFPRENQPVQQEWQAPPPPFDNTPVAEPPQMSEVGTLGSIFFEPGRTFEDLRRKPRFILGALLITLLASVLTSALAYKIGDENMKRFMVEQFEKNPQTQQMSGEQKTQAMALQLTIITVTRYLVPLFVIIGLAIGGLIYWLAIKAFGGSGNYLHALSIWIYASIPPTVVMVIANCIVLLLKSTDEIDVATSQRGVLTANPSFLIDGKASPVLATLIGTLDVFMIWGWVLAAIGLRITGKISSGSAWGIVLILALVGLTFRILFSYLNGVPM